MQLASAKCNTFFFIRSGRSVWRKTSDCLMWTRWILKVSRVWDLQKQMDRQTDKNRASISGCGRWRMSRVPHMPAWALLNQQHVNSENRQAAAGFHQPTEALWTQPVRHPHMHAHTHTWNTHMYSIYTHTYTNHPPKTHILIFVSLFDVHRNNKLPSSLPSPSQLTPRA